MTKSPVDPVELARSVTRDVFEVLVDVMTHPEATHANRLSAALALWDRGWGKPAQPDKSGKGDERAVSDLTIGTSYSLEQKQSSKILTTEFDGQPEAGEPGSADVCEHDRDPGRAGSS